MGTTWMGTGASGWEAHLGGLEMGSYVALQPDASLVSEPCGGFTFWSLINRHV